MKIQIGDKVFDAEIKDGIPVIKAKAEEIRHPDGRVDVKVHVPCMNVQGKKT